MNPFQKFNLGNLLVIFPLIAVAGIGDIDRRFGSNGELFNYCGQSKVPTQAALQSDDKLVIVCQAPSNKDTFDVIRLLANGTSDSSFGTSGKVVIDVSPTFNDAVGAIKIQSDDKIVLAGISSTSPKTSYALRLGANGAADLGFGTSNGTAIQVTAWTSVRSISIGSTGNIFIAGLGGVIPSFFGLDSTGVPLNISRGEVGTDALVLAQGADKILFYTNDEFKRYVLGGLANISVDSSFSSPYNLSNYSGRDSLIEDTSNRSFVNLSRINSDGSIDYSFNAEYIANFNHSVGISRRENGGLMATGQRVIDSGMINWMLAAYDANGKLNKSFGSKGYVEHSITINSTLRQMVHQKLGRAILIGERLGESYAVAFMSPDAKGAALDKWSVAFPDTEVLKRSAPIAVTLSNSSTESFDINSVMINGQNTADYEMTKTCGSSLASGASCVMNIIFQPNSVGTKTSSLYISTSSPQGSLSVPLTGNGINATPIPIASVSLSEITFPNTLTGNASQWLSATISNTGTGSFSINSAIFTQGTHFVVSGSCPPIFLPNTSCEIQFKFTPQSAGPISDTFNIATNAPQGVLTISLSGEGLASGTAHAALSNTIVAFNDIYVNTGSRSSVINLSNSGTAPFNVGSLALNGSSSFDYSSDCPNIVASGTYCSITVYFTPTSAGSFSGALDIVTDAPESTLSVNISGTAITATGTGLAEANVTSISFPNTAIGDSNTFAFGLRNSGTAPFFIEDFSTTSSSFQIRQLFLGDTCSVPLAPEGSCSYIVTFTPQIEGNLSDEVRIKTTAPEGVISFPLSGTGVVAKAAIDVSAITFPDTIVKTHSSIKSITITNSGTNGFLVVNVFGEDASWFVVSNHCIGTIAPGSSCKIDVDFFAFTTGSVTSQLRIATGAPEGTFTVTLSGKGIAATTSESGGGGGGGGTMPLMLMAGFCLVLWRRNSPKRANEPTKKSRQNADL